MAKTSPMTSLQVDDLSTQLIKNLSIVNHHLILNTIFLDKSYDLSTYLIKNYCLNNSES